MHGNKTLIVARNCNNNCINCLFLHKSLPADVHPENDAREKLSSFAERRLSLKTISLTGGEPTLNTGLFGILKETRSLFRDTEISILSNGRMFAYGDYTTRLRDLKLGNIKVAVPLYGHTPLLHDSITQTRGSFVQTSDGIRNLLEAGIPVEARIIINNRNHDQLGEIVHFILKEFPDVLYVVLIAMELNKELVANGSAVRYTEFVPHLKSALDLSRTDKIRLFHFPLCIIDRHFWKAIRKSVDDRKLSYLAACADCAARKKCMGILKTYLAHIGKDEFSPIKKD